MIQEWDFWAGALERCLHCGLKPDICPDLRWSQFYGIKPIWPHPPMAELTFPVISDGWLRASQRQAKLLVKLGILKEK